jgi:hypothetical protein
MGGRRQGDIGRQMQFHQGNAIPATISGNPSAAARTDSGARIAGPETGRGRGRRVGEEIAALESMTMATATGGRRRRQRLEPHRKW